MISNRFETLKKLRITKADIYLICIGWLLGMITMRVVFLLRGI